MAKAHCHPMYLSESMFSSEYKGHKPDKASCQQFLPHKLAGTHIYIFTTTDYQLSPEWIPKNLPHRSVAFISINFMRECTKADDHEICETHASSDKYSGKVSTDYVLFKVHIRVYEIQWNITVRLKSQTFFAKVIRGSDVAHVKGSKILQEDYF